MKLVLMMCLALVSLVGRGAATPVLDQDELEDLSKRYPFFLVVPPRGDQPLRYVYADVAQHIHVFSVKDGKAKPEWETASMGSDLTALLLAEDQSGENVLLVATLAGRIVVYDLDDYRMRYEHFQDRFDNITCLTAANLDDDPQSEVVFISQRILYVYDANSRFMEWKSNEPHNATELLIADVDDDPQPEIILNSGAIVDSRFREIEVESRNRPDFGRRIRLVDLNGDGSPEILGEGKGFSLTLFDIRRREEIW